MQIAAIAVRAGMCASAIDPTRALRSSHPGWLHRPQGKTALSKQHNFHYASQKTGGVMNARIPARGFEGRASL